MEQIDFTIQTPKNGKRKIEGNRIEYPRITNLPGNKKTGNKKHTTVTNENRCRICNVLLGSQEDKEMSKVHGVMNNCMGVWF